MKTKNKRFSSFLSHLNGEYSRITHERLASLRYFPSQKYFRGRKAQDRAPVHRPWGNSRGTRRTFSLFRNHHREYPQGTERFQEAESFAHNPMIFPSSAARFPPEPFPQRFGVE